MLTKFSMLFFATFLHIAYAKLGMASTLDNEVKLIMTSYGKGLVYLLLFI